jgi:hypothetical protein
VRTRGPKSAPGQVASLVVASDLLPPSWRGSWRSLEETGTAKLIKVRRENLRAETLRDELTIHAVSAPEQDERRRFPRKG